MSKARPIWTPEDKSRLGTMFHAGSKDAEIGAAMGRSVAAVEAERKRQKNAPWRSIAQNRAAQCCR